MIADSILSSDSPILVTGSAGFIGAKVVETLLRQGFTNLRCFVRPTSRLERLRQVLDAASSSADVQIVTGDLVSRDDCRRAAERVEVVYHLAAGVDKSFAGAFMNSAIATRNLMDAFLEQERPKRFVAVSSFSVYSNLHMERGALLDETAPLEDAPQERFSAYVFGKLKQEELVRQYGTARDLPFVILRPGAVFGPGKRDITGRIAINTFGFLLHMGGANQIPFTFVDNCAEAIVLAGIKPGVEGEIFNIVDDELPTSADVFHAYKQRLGARFSLPVPYSIAECLCRFWENYSTRSGGQLPAVFNRRRCAAEWRGNRYSNRKIREKLGWSPRVPMAEAINAFLAQFEPAKA